MKILICGWGRSGKDTLAEMLGLSYRSSSEVVLEHAIWKDWGQSRYDTMADCFADRSNHRQKWFEFIRDFNLTDGSRLAKIILKDNECYVGLRRKEELEACDAEGLFDLKIWVNAEGRVPDEGDSCTITEAMCDVTIDNIAGIEEFTGNVVKLAHYLNGFQAGAQRQADLYYGSGLGI